MARRTPLLVLGLGNLICGDDGLGVDAVLQLQREYDAPEGARVLDGGTLGLALLPEIELAERAILVDAVRDEAPVGSFVRLEGDHVAPAVAARLSPHQVGVADLLEAARWLGRYPKSVLLLGLVPGSIELGLERSAAVEANLRLLVERVVEEAGRLGFEFRAREDHEPPAGARAADGTGILRV
ncbi:MAG: HyaD/HybD family hydrogenase maturation endopeptidase [Thermoanaerobaculia bacterium]